MITSISELRAVYLGAKPFVLIEPEPADGITELDDGGFSLGAHVMAGGGIDTKSAVVAVLESALHATREHLAGGHG